MQNAMNSYPPGLKGVCMGFYVRYPSSQRNLCPVQ